MKEKTIFSEPENTQRKARKALKRKLKACSKKSYPLGEMTVCKLADGKYKAFVEICDF